MRIALVSEFYYPHLGGVTEHVHNLAQRFRDRGHEVVVITSRVAGDTEERPGVRNVGRSRLVYANGSFARFTTGSGVAWRIAQVLRQESIDIVHVHGGLVPTLGLTAPRVAQKLGIPVVGTFHSWFPRAVSYRVLRRPLQREFSRMAVHIAVSEPVVDAFSRYFRGDWEIIPNGVDTGQFRPDARFRPDASRPPRLLFLGRLDPRNGLDTMLAAMPGVLERHPSAQLIVVGDGPLRGMYERHARPLGDAVRFVGHVLDARRAYYSGADMYVCPTKRASFGITLLEAMACGTPLLVSDIIGFRELVAGGEEAELVPPEDASAWARRIGDLLDDPQRRQRMGEAGRAKAARYSWDRIAEQVLGVYESVLRRERIAA
jgi:phosphatidylinositol alpha-mannosyltransferase